MRSKKINLIILIIIFFYSIIKADNRCLNIIVKMNDKLSTDYTLVTMDSLSNFYEMPSVKDIKVGEYYIEEAEIDKIFKNATFIKIRHNRKNNDSIMVRLLSYRDLKSSNLCFKLITKKNEDYEYKYLSREEKKDYLYGVWMYSNNETYFVHEYKTTLFNICRYDYVPLELDPIPTISERIIDVTDRNRLNLTVFINNFCSYDHIIYRKNKDGVVIYTIKYEYNKPGAYIISKEDYNDIINNPYNLYLYVKYSHVPPVAVDVNDLPCDCNKKEDFLEIPLSIEDLQKDYIFWNIYTTDYEYSRKECRKNKKLIQSNPYSTSPFLIEKE